MKVEDVPDEWVEAARSAFFHATGPKISDDWRTALAAVIPAIQADALERAAWALDQQAAAIRALKEPGDEG
jgi:hypothetical protein